MLDFDRAFQDEVQAVAVFPFPNQDAVAREVALAAILTDRGEMLLVDVSEDPVAGNQLKGAFE